MSNMCGLGLPAISLSASVRKNDDARDKASPIHAVFHSQIFLRQMRAGVALDAVGPGTRMRETSAITTPGTIRQTIATTETDTVSAR